MIDTLFTIDDELFAGTDDGGGKFSGHPVVNGELTSGKRSSSSATPIGRIVGLPLDLKIGDRLPGNTDLRLEGATTVTIGRYLDGVAKLQEKQPEQAAKAAPDAKKAKPTPKERSNKKKLDDKAAEEKAQEAGE